MSKYMHTLDGKPAYFVGDQICFADHGVKVSELFVDSLRTIRRQQQDTIAFRRSMNWNVDASDYGYLRVKDE